MLGDRVGGVVEGGLHHSLCEDVGGSAQPEEDRGLGCLDGLEQGHGVWEIGGSWLDSVRR